MMGQQQTLIKAMGDVEKAKRAEREASEKIEARQRDLLEIDMKRRDIKERNVELQKAIEITSDQEEVTLEDILIS